MTRTLRSTKTHGTRTAKIYHDTEWSEYVVRLYLDGDLFLPADCYCENLKDAEDTAEIMLRKGDELIHKTEP